MSDLQKHDVPGLVRGAVSEAEFFSPEPKLLRRVLTHSPQMMLIEHHMELGWEGARHSHPHEQLVYIISGHLRFSRGDEVFEARSGDSFVVA
jgi:quercetin dioxygenase-like cupin family protein